MRDLPMRPELLARFREGDLAAVHEVYREFVQRLSKWLENRHPCMPSAADHADAVQEVFMRAFQREARLAYDGKRDYWSYLLGIASHVVSDFWRKRGREVIAPGRDSSDPADVLARAAHPDAEEPPAHGWQEAKAHAGLHPSSIQRLVERLRREARALLEQAGIRDSNPSAA